jgi:hypothetical protein
VSAATTSNPDTFAVSLCDEQTAAADTCRRCACFDDTELAPSPVIGSWSGICWFATDDFFFSAFFRLLDTDFDDTETGMAVLVDGTTVEVICASVAVITGIRF